MNKNKKILKYIIINVLILIIIYLCYLTDKRICLIYNLFKVPCPGCGLTRAIFCFFKGDILGSLQYNLMGILLVLSYIACFIWKIIDIINGKDTLGEKLNNKKVIAICIIIFIISYARNLTNSLLY